MPGAGVLEGLRVGLLTGRPGAGTATETGGSVGGEGYTPGELGVAGAGDLFVVVAGLGAVV